MPSWDLEAAINCRWDEEELDRQFRMLWPDPSVLQYEPLNDREARPSPPGPYCVYHTAIPDVIGHSSGSQDRDMDEQYVRAQFEFHVHARSKKVARDLAKKVAKAFDPNQSLRLPDGSHIRTVRGPDWGRRLGDTEWVWTLQYEALVDWSQAKPDEIVVPAPTVPTVPSAPAEVDDVLDFGDLPNAVYDDAGAAVANRNALLAYFSARAALGKAAVIGFRGPKNPSSYNQTREPGVVYFDLSSGPMSVTVGGSGNIADLQLFGMSRIEGVNAATGITPVFKITRAAGSTPNIVLDDLQINSNGSGIHMVTPGATTMMDGVHVTYSGTGSLDNDAWTDLDTASFALKVEEADGLHVRNFSCSSGGGHGVIVKRWHAGTFHGNCRVCAGSGFKAEQVHLTDVRLRTESNSLWGLHLRDTGHNRRNTSGSNVAEEGSPTDWEVWCEANNGRGSPYAPSGSAGYAYPQTKVETSSRNRFMGHTGWRDNQVRVDDVSRLRNEWIEERRTVLSQTPSFQLVDDDGDSPTYLVDSNITLPTTLQVWITNWHQIWTNASYRPSAAIMGAGTEADPEFIRITWPANSYNNTAVLDTGYWRPWGATPLNSPGTFRYEVEVSDVDGAIASYCLARDAASNRQTSRVAGFNIAPVAGGISFFPLWDTKRRKFSGTISVDQSRGDISIAFDAFANGLQDQEGNAPQDSIHMMDIHQIKVWKLAA